MEKKSRLIIQFISTAFFNGYCIGIQKGLIFQGSSKMVCLPFLNCYSCPGAMGACPIGALQAVVGDRKYQFSFYVVGFLMLFGILAGRAVCGFLCPFGLIQDLLYKIKLPKVSVHEYIDRPLRYLKYIVLIFFVILGPMYLTNAFDMGNPYFCKLICPAGTLEGGIPLILSNPLLQNVIGSLFFWKISILVCILLLSIFIYRPFCKYLCPLGAFYGIFNQLSFYRLEVDADKCDNCGLCKRVCKMGVDIANDKYCSECIRCGECESMCPHNAIRKSRKSGD